MTDSEESKIVWVVVAILYLTNQIYLKNKTKNKYIKASFVQGYLCSGAG